MNVDILRNKIFLRYLDDEYSYFSMKLHLRLRRLKNLKKLFREENEDFNNHFSKIQTILKDSYLNSAKKHYKESLNIVEDILNNINLQPKLLRKKEFVLKWNFPKEKFKEEKYTEKDLEKDLEKERETENSIRLAQEIEKIFYYFKNLRNIVSETDILSYDESIDIVFTIVKKEVIEFCKRYYEEIISNQIKNFMTDL